MSSCRNTRPRQVLHSASRALILLTALASVAGAGSRPCPFPDRADRSCILENPEQRARAGTRCEIHRRTKLKLDLVLVHHDFVGYTPGLGGDERVQFPNARPWWSGGCVDYGIPFAEVAYCTECRAAWKFAMAWARLQHLWRDR